MPLINYIGNRQECLDNKRGRGNAPSPIFLDYLVVGGGAYGNTEAGGAGGVVSGSIRFLPRFTLDVTVGNGGTGSTLIGAQPSLIQSVPNDFFIYAGSGSYGSSGYPQFNPAGLSTSNYSRPGAGGSAQSGSSPAADNIGGAGGTGSFWLDGNCYAGGGGGRGAAIIASQAIGGVGGQGGGGNGAGFTTTAVNGVVNTGGGGGGTLAAATNGGSGIVKMRYVSGSITGATGGQTSVSGGYVYHSFTASGQFIYQP